MKQTKKLVVPAVAPRNPLVRLAKFRQAGTHQKSHKALRRQFKSQAPSLAY